MRDTCWRAAGIVLTMASMRLTMVAAMMVAVGCAGDPTMPAVVDGTAVASSGVANGESCDERFANDFPVSVRMHEPSRVSVLSGTVLFGESCEAPKSVDDGWLMECHRSAGNPTIVWSWIASDLTVGQVGYATETIVWEGAESHIETCTWTYDLVDITPAYCGDDGLDCDE